MSVAKAGIIGCGNISGIYFKTMCNRLKDVDLVACADLVEERAQAKAAEFEGVQAMSVEELLSNDEIEVVVNLTIPKAHFEVAMKAVEAGKSVHSEKPLTLTREEGSQLLAAAAEKSVLVGNAPDTFMGAGIQACRKLIDDGAIGEPVAATAFMMCHGHEAWHPDPEFYYQAGGGPMFDMGPYYLTALVNLLGPVKTVTGSARASFPTRTITSEKKNGQVIDVKVPTHVAGILDFAAGAVGTVITSFDIWGHTMPCIEIHGTEGSMQVPDPNGFGGRVRIIKPREKEWTEIPLTHAYADNSRGIGVADLARALKTGRPHRANGKMAYHVLDIMHAFHDASDEGRHIELTSSCERPTPMPEGLEDGELD